MRVNIIALLIIVLLSGSACNQDPAVYDETPTRGNVKISVDESYKMLLDTEIYTFQTFYKYAKINAEFKPENELFSDFFKDSVRAIITCRKLTQAEEDGLKSQQIIPRTTKIAYDALAVITNKDNPDTVLGYDQFKGIFLGKNTNWKQINPKSELGDMVVVFDNEKSANVRYIREKFGMGVKFPDYCSAVKTNDEVINYVEKNKNAIGIISVNWISDKDDSLSLNFLDRIRVLAIGSELGKGSNDEFYYRPYQGYIADGSYPFIREVYYISRESFAGLGTGFVSWLAADQGQRIILKSGLVPATMPIRLIQVKHQ